MLRKMVSALFAAALSLGVTGHAEAAGPGGVGQWCSFGGVKIKHAANPVTVPPLPDGYVWTLLVMSSPDVPGYYTVSNPAVGASYTEPYATKLDWAILCLAAVEPTTTVVTEPPTTIPEPTTTIADTTTVPPTTTTVVDTTVAATTTTPATQPSTSGTPSTTAAPSVTTTSVASRPVPGVVPTTSAPGVPPPPTSISASHAPPPTLPLAPGVTVAAGTTTAAPGQSSSPQTTGVAGTSTTPGTTQGTAGTTAATTPGQVAGTSTSGPKDTAGNDARITEAILPASATRLSHPRSSADGYVFIALIALFCAGVLVAERTAAHRRT